MLSLGSMGSPSSDIYPGGGVSVGGTTLCGDSIFVEVPLGHIPTASMKPAGCESKLKCFHLNTYILNFRHNVIS